MNSAASCGEFVLPANRANIKDMLMAAEMPQQRSQASLLQLDAEIMWAHTRQQARQDKTLLLYKKLIFCVSCALIVVWTLAVTMH